MSVHSALLSRRSLQTFRSAGAGKARGRQSLLQTFRSAGAGRRKADGHYYKHSAPLERGRREADSRYYKHSAPLERGRREADSRYHKHSAPLEREGARPTVTTTNIPLRWSGKAQGRRSLQTFRSAGADGRGRRGALQQSDECE